MPQKRRFTRKQQRPPSASPRVANPQRSLEAYDRKAPTQYGKPFILLEDQNMNTFEYSAGAWVPYSLSIAQCRQEFQVKVLPQKVNGKTRYEIRRALPAAD